MLGTGTGRVPQLAALMHLPYNLQGGNELLLEHGLEIDAATGRVTILGFIMTCLLGNDVSLPDITAKAMSNVNDDLKRDIMGEWKQSNDSFLKACGLTATQFTEVCVSLLCFELNGQ